MSKQISITVDTDDANALNHAADMFYNMASEVGDEVATPSPVQIEPSTPHPNEPRANVVPIAPSSTNRPGKAIKPGDTITVDGEYVAPEGVELDADGLPWDVRIHGAAKKKLAKEKTWKKIKNLETNKPGLIAEVEAELREAMAAPVGGIPEEPPLQGNGTSIIPVPPAVETPTPVPVESEAVYNLNNIDYTHSQLLQAGWKESDIAGLTPSKPAVTPAPVDEGMIFPQLMQKITGALGRGEITDPQVTAAVNAQGLASLVLLSARPDLIGVVHDGIFPNG